MVTFVLHIMYYSVIVLLCHSLVELLSYGTTLFLKLFNIIYKCKRKTIF